MVGQQTLQKGSWAIGTKGVQAAHENSETGGHLCGGVLSGAEGQ